ncbi:MAG TPA: hypothetical protein VKT78_06985 [Fimbriimonadaceae bacterium]|nr:hypothetical protein [Fimbriimonadaceae bacterium]
MRAKQIFGLVGISILLASCGGNGRPYSPSGNSPDWEFVLGAQPAAKAAIATPTPAVPRAKRMVGNVPVLVNLGNLTPGQVVAPINILAVALNGFTGSVALSDVASASPDHIAAVPSVASVNPTVAGAPFTVGFTVPANYPFPGTGVEFQGKDAANRIKQELIAFNVVTVSGSFTPAVFQSNAGAGNGPLTITPINGFTGPVTITFDTNLTGAPTGFQPLPNTVQVTAPNSPVTISGANPVTTPVNFSWSSWSPGSYEVIAVLTKGTMAVRVPVQITVVAGGSGAAVVTWHNDNARTGQYAQESLLTQGNVGPATFGRLFTVALDAPTEGQPLYVPGVKIGGVSHNVVYVCTLNDSVYAFDADNGGAPLWHTSLGSPVPLGQENAGNEPLDGILSTPVIDIAANTIFVVAKVQSEGPDLQIHGLDLSTGAEVAGGPKSFGANIPGSINTVQFLPQNSYQRPGLLLLNGVVYVGVGGQFGDPAPDRGWIFGFTESNLSNSPSIYTTCDDIKGTNFAGGSIWMAGAGLASDGTFIYATTGNGDFDANTGGKDYGDSILKLQPAGSSLNVVDSFTPFNQSTLAQDDLDVGSGGPVLIPSQSGSGQMLIEMNKTNEVYIATTNSMGGFNNGSDNIHQEFSLSDGKEHLCTPAYYNGSVFLGRGNLIVGYDISSGTLNTAPFATSSTTFGAPYLPTPTISFNGALSGANQATTAIVWAIDKVGSNAVLRAYAASTLHELYNSQNGVDNGGNYTKFAIPTVANGKVYLPCANELAVYGLKATLQVKRKK